MNIFARQPRPGPPREPPLFWARRVPEMRMEEAMANLDREIGQLDRRDFIERPRDLDEGRPIPAEPDLFADGLEIAHAILDWEARAGQPIAPLIEHIKAAQQLRKTVTEKANAPTEGAPT